MLWAIERILLPRKRIRTHVRKRQSEPIGGRCQPMDGSKVIVEQVDVSACDLNRARAVPQDALEAEHVPAVHQEGARERVAQHVRRAACFDACPPRQSMDELMDPSRG